LEIDKVVEDPWWGERPEWKEKMLAEAHKTSGGYSCGKKLGGYKAGSRGGRSFYGESHAITQGRGHIKLFVEGT